MAKPQSLIVISAFLFFLLITSGDVGMTKMAEARTCSTMSRNFTGLCFNDANCSTICKWEGFVDGKCDGFIRQCYCREYCA